MTKVVLFNADLPSVYRRTRQGRKGQPCRVLVRGSMNSCLVVFVDGFRMVTSRNSLKRNVKKAEGK